MKISRFSSVSESIGIVSGLFSELEVIVYDCLERVRSTIFDRGGALRRSKFSIVVVALGILSSASFWRGNQVGGLPRHFT